MDVDDDALKTAVDEGAAVARNVTPPGRSAPDMPQGHWE
jgi:hypothetical protein